MSHPAPSEPAGPLPPVEPYSEEAKHSLIAELAAAPGKLREATAHLQDSQLDTRYRNWTIRQIVHHVADSHVHSYVRFKWTLTEPTPTIKAYEEADWVQLEDSLAGDIEPPLALLDGLHLQWVQTLRVMSEPQYSRSFIHPQSKETVTLWSALNYYPWHARHHTGQILWLRELHGW